MSTAEMKIKLITRINETNNPDMLKDMLRFLEINEDENDIYIVSDEKKEGLIKARQSIASGILFSNEAVNKEIDEWLNA